MTFANTFQATFSDVFIRVRYDELTHRFHLTVKHGIMRVKFLGGLNMALGVRDGERLFDAANIMKRVIIGEVAPCLYNGITSPMFLTNIVEPSGHKRVLKTVHINPGEYDFGEVVSHSFQTPMYRKVALASINTIEIMAKTPNKTPAPFVYGSHTAVTLHFKKDNNNEGYY